MQAQQSSDKAVFCKPRALVSVSDKTGLEMLGKSLINAGFELVATHSTAQFLADLGVPSVSVESITRVPEMLGGRVKTLHPAVFGGILWKRASAADQGDALAHGLPSIDVVVCNLYPFADHANQNDINTVVEYIDVGGVSLLRAAAKNFRDCLVLSDPADYELVTSAVLAKKPALLSLEQRRALAAKAFRTTALYDALIANRIAQADDATLESTTLPDPLLIAATLKQTLRYGENPHQRAAVYQSVTLQSAQTLVGAQALQGKELSYNNLLDAEHALRLVREWKTPAVAILKHNTPCGVALSESDLCEAYERAFRSDPVSPFGGIVCCNRPIDKSFAARLTETFLEVIIAPHFTPEAREHLAGKKNLRLLELDPSTVPTQPWQMVSVNGGFLLQSADSLAPAHSLKCVTDASHTTQSVLDDLTFAMTVVKHVRSNAIVLACDRTTVAIAGGFTNRVDAVRNCLQKLNEQTWTVGRPIVLASDGFFPFADSIEALQGTGITHVVQPGGSQRDGEVIEACRKFGIAMYLTGARHFKH